jgi:hypothetical protein
LFVPVVGRNRVPNEHFHSSPARRGGIGFLDFVSRREQQLPQAQVSQL